MSKKNKTTQVKNKNLIMRSQAEEEARIRNAKLEELKRRRWLHDDNVDHNVDYNVDYNDDDSNHI